MTPDQMMVLGTAFAAYLRIFEVCIAYQPTAEHFAFLLPGVAVGPETQER